MQNCFDVVGDSAPSHRFDLSWLFYSKDSFTVGLRRNLSETKPGETVKIALVLLVTAVLTDPLPNPLLCCNSRVVSTKVSVENVDARHRPEVHLPMRPKSVGWRALQGEP